MRLFVRNLSEIRGRDPRLAELVDDILEGMSNISDQVVASPSKLVTAPPTASSLTVTASNGLFHAVIYDNNPVLRGVVYFLEWSTAANFAAPHVIFLGPAREHWGMFGNQTLYFRAYSQYPTSGPSAPIYFGSQSSPTAVNGGGTITGPSPIASTGSGTAPSTGTQGGAGYGYTITRGKVRFE